MTLGNAYQGLGESDKALAAFQKAMAQDPGFSAAHFNAASLLLRQGSFKKGWEAFEHRWDPQSGYIELSRCGFTQPRWRGQSPEQMEGRLLVVGEMGFGDVIQFVRYISMLAERGYDVLLEVHAELRALIAASLEGLRVEVIPRRFYRWDRWGLSWMARLTGQRLQAAGRTEIYRNLPFAAWTGLMSLPAFFDTVEDTIPTQVPYLKTDPKRVEDWRKFLNSLPGRLKVGFVWAGSANNSTDKERSLTVDQLSKFFDLEDIQFVSLQKGRKDEPLPERDNVFDAASKLKDFRDTAAAIEALDLVLTVDTSVAHLAGALAKPVWIMIPKIKDWRWGTEGNTNPWYPTVRIFRQPVQGEWLAVTDAVCEALDQELAQGRTE